MTLRFFIAFCHFLNKAIELLYQGMALGVRHSGDALRRCPLRGIRGETVSSLDDLMRWSLSIQNSVVHVCKHQNAALAMGSLQALHNREQQSAYQVLGGGKMHFCVKDSLYGCPSHSRASRGVEHGGNQGSSLGKQQGALV
jgi:hypothetical protein